MATEQASLRPVGGILQRPLRDLIALVVDRTASRCRTLAGVGLPQVGERAPAFTVETHDGRSLNGRDLYVDGPLILLFDDCTATPHGPASALLLDGAAPMRRRLGATAVLVRGSAGCITPDLLPDAVVVNDPAGAAAAAFGLPATADPARAAAKIESGGGAAPVADRPSEPAVFVIDGDGLVLWSAQGNEVPGGIERGIERALARSEERLQALAAAHAL